MGKVGGHDWQKMVGERLCLRGSQAAERDEVIAELAAHLEETYETARARGLGDPEALTVALQEVEDWHALAENIACAKSGEGPMNTRTKSLWLPGMATLLGASLWLMLLQRAGFQPRLVWIGHAAMLFYWPWLAALPVFGALGSYLARRSQGSTRLRLAAGLSPALVLLALMCFFLLWGLAFDGFSAFRLFYFGLAVINWVVIPGLALLLGALPFLRESRPLERGRAASGA